MNTLLKMWLAVSLAVSLAGVAPAAQSKGAARTHTRHVFVSVADQTRGTPILDLQPGDFDLTEGGIKREVARARLATDPMRIVLVVDTSDGTAKALTDIRNGLVAFLEALPPEHEVMLVTTGRQTRVRVPPTTDRRKLREAAAGLFSDGGASIFSDTLLEIDDRFLRKAEDRWPVIVMVTGDGAEGSSPANEKRLNDWVAALPARGISAHAIALKYKGGGMPEIIASHVTETAAGRYDFINTSNSLPEKLGALGKAVAADAAQMRTKYAVDFLTDAKDLPPVDVGIMRANVVIQTSYRRRFR